MANSQLYPFERNRYYPGKMLTTADFQAEQSYHMNKQRFMSSLMYGAGIICGCNVVNLDDLSILVESGVVIDGTGREIIIDSSLVKKLSAIEGFEQLHTDTACLCVRYKEKDIHSVYAVSHKESDQEYEYNRISEGFELFLVDKEDYNEGIEFETEFLQSETLFRTSNYEGSIVIPTIACKGKNVRALLKIKKLSNQEVKVSYKGILDIPSFTSPEGTEQIDISVDEVDLAQGTVFTKEFWMTAQKHTGIETNIILRSGSASAFENDKAISVENSFAMKIRLSEETPQALIGRELGRLSLEMRQAMTRDNIKLAEVDLLRTDSAYVIEAIREPVTNQYIDVPAQNAIRNRYMEFFVKDVDIAEKRSADIPASYQIPLAAPAASELKNVATGVLEIPLGRDAKAGDIRYSGEITHGLGNGNVFVSIGYEYLSQDQTLGASAKSTVYGNPELFSRQAQQLVDAETAVRVLNDKGSFVVAARLLHDVDFLVLTYRWVAIKFPNGKELDAEDYYGKTITAKTPTVVMRPRENYYFGVQFNNMDPVSITYELTAPGSGEVSVDGVYTAPAKEGVYEIRIYCSDMPMVCTYAYAIVKSTATEEDAGSIAEQEKEPIVKIPDLKL
ncbi:hypothetical protein NXH67_10760 [Butyrivibrio sp. DSM 10294]|uniref:hypothetical protein n=1 Tax=Butyrivibrio sp. DSM 10294 TaxID=2972457 RepID=UPI00234ED078|nr:hypothetical protein [Butyrivibrio sp. DSM 10294]MDC7293995.1 hypothetical protein [Butyrivibrio sp. DSM 10294]